MSQKPYMDYRFLGIHSFISTLESTGADFRLFDEDYSHLFSTHSELINPCEDTIRSGIVSRDEQSVFFSEFSIKLTKSYSAHIVFLFNHHPTNDDLAVIVLDLERIVMENIENIDVNQMAEALDERAAEALKNRNATIN